MTEYQNTPRGPRGNLLARIFSGLLASALLAATSGAFAGAGEPGHVHEHEAEEHGFAFGQPANAADAVRTVNIEARDIEFVPKSVEIARGATVRFVIRNTGRLDHEFVLGDEHEQKEHAEEMRRMGSSTMHKHANAVTVPAGETREFVWKFPDRPVALQYACHVPGHFEAGMVGSIEVK